MADDDELAARIVSRGQAPARGQRGVPLLSWSAQREQTAAITDLLVSVRQQILAGQLPRGKRPPKVPPAPRPRAALQRAEQRHSLDRHRFIVAKVLPGGDG